MKLKFLFCVYVQLTALQHQYDIILEDFVIDFIDNKLMDLQVDVVPINKTKTLNFCFKSKVDIPPSTMITAEAFKLVGTKYTVPVLQIRKRLKDIIQMELFDFQTLWIRICRPPMVWPIEKNTAYRMNNWTPNGTNFPPNLPSGKFRVRMTQSFANKTKFIVLSCYGRIEYFKTMRKFD